jgi:hypothetical protein
MKSTETMIEMRAWSRKQRLKEAVIASLCEPAPNVAARLTEFSERDWWRALYWMDISGIALYVLDRVKHLGLEDCMPATILDRLENNLRENSDRALSLFSDAIALSLKFEQKNIEFALLKGITLCPESVPNSALRCQMDIDVLVREAHADEARRCLESLGYALDVVSGPTWEFKAGAGVAQYKDMYRVRPQRCVDLHLLPSFPEGGNFQSQDLLARAQLRSFHGLLLPVLSPEDLFVQQALHLFKHICSEYLRVFWLLEFWRHVVTRKADARFWRDVMVLARTTPGAETAIGVSTLMATLMFGKFAPEELSQWSMDRLSPSICLWVKLYGRRSLLASFPGSKLYLLLQRQLIPDTTESRAAIRRRIFPIHRPSSVTRATPGEKLTSRISRYRVQGKYLYFRVRIHVIGGLRYAIESLRWKRRVADLNKESVAIMVPAGGSIDG